MRTGGKKAKLVGLCVEARDEPASFLIHQNGGLGASTRDWDQNLGFKVSY